MKARLSALARSYTGFERDARLFLVATFISGAALNLYWIDFNLYLRALGFEPSTIGLVTAAGSAAAALAAFPASIASDRFGRRRVLMAGVAIMGLTASGYLVTSGALAIALLTAAYGAGQQAFFVLTAPYLTEHSRAEHRSELFALQFALGTVSGFLVAPIAGVLATELSRWAGLDPTGADPYRLIILAIVALVALTFLLVARLSDDRPRPVPPPQPRDLGEPAAFPIVHQRRRSPLRSGLVVHDRARFVRILLPGFLIALGAGQVIPYLNVFVQGKFGLDLSQLNVIFALTQLGTTAAILAQPLIARRMGKIGSVVAVQGASIPFLLVLGFSPILWPVIVALAVRNALMNAGNPIFTAFAMEHVDPAERATLSAAMSVLWSVAWVIAAPWYSLLQATLGFEAGYRVSFITIIALYSTATALTWAWFRRAEHRADPAVGTPSVADATG